MLLPMTNDLMDSSRRYDDLTGLAGFEYSIVGQLESLTTPAGT